ncbi:cell wall-binding repeat-containing protein [Anaerosoma tenue]|uniref:cell wall-binding repeat-containing protein n=1 Tax=Anaerosoma tenue TaxID=2933588 RepID=UPI002260DCA0|nr:cell wall-binding repeat-containing protein [Anaerosoma tenue]MCK8114888.1 cell wall-binding repeat-containing protein [Anaerosoma tenue]
MVGRVYRSRLVRVFTVAACLMLVMPAVGFSAPPLAAQTTIMTYWVDAVEGDDGNPGTEADPFKTITHALAVSTGPDTIMVEPGMYDSANLEVFPLLNYGQTLIGTAGAESTVIQGDGSDQVMACQGFSDGDAIEGFTFTNSGTISKSAVGIYLNNATSAGWPRIKDNVFAGNASSAPTGGALSMVANPPLATAPAVVSNEFLLNSAAEGGAIRISGSVSATIRDNVFQGNSASGVGGAIQLAPVDSGIIIYGNTFADNAAGSSGGAIRVSSTGGQMVTINRNSFIENAAGGSGGAMWLFGASVSMEVNDAAGNDANGGSGGFAYLENCTAEARNNVIGGHSATGEGAAWYLTSASLSETNDTVVQCTGTDSAAYWQGPGQLDVYNSIYWNPALDADIENAQIIEYSCLYDSAPGTHGNGIGSGVIHDDPHFIDLAGHDARLAMGSPCIDTANTAVAPAGDYYGTLRPQDGDGDGSSIADMGFFEKPPLVLTPLEGEDRYATAVEIAEATFETAEYAVVASGENFPDALSAAGLAGAYECPLVLTRSAALPGVTAAFLASRGVETVFIIGGPAAVSQAVFDALDGDYNVTLISGSDRYATAAKVARAIADHQGAAFGQVAFIARGDSFPDALSLSPLAFSQGVPILLTATNTLPAATATALNDLDIRGGVVAGGLTAVSAGTKASIDAIVIGNGGAELSRWSGSDRYDTAAQIANKAIQGGLASWSHVGVATGENYPDALAGGARIGMGGGVVLLTASDSLPVVTKGALASNRAKVLYLDVFGGPSAVSAGVRTALETALGW